MNRFKRTLSIVLSVAMGLQLGFTPAFAAEPGATTTKTVTAFAELAEDEKSITLPLGSTENEVLAALPATLSATVETVSVQDSGTATSGLSSVNGQPEKSVTPVAVTWALSENTVFSTAASAKLTYKAKLYGSDYTLAQGVSLPEINVTMGIAKYLSDEGFSPLTRLEIGGNSVTLPADGQTTYSNSNEEDSVWWLTCTGAKYSLTLNGADITNTATSSDSTRGIDAQGDLELVLQKTNTVTAAANNLSHGIYVNGDLTVTGGGTLTATGGTASGSSDGVNVKGNLAVKNGCLKGIGGKAKMSTGVSAGLYTSISDNGEIEGIGGEAFDSQGVNSKKTITVTGGKLTGTGGKAEHYSYGIYTYPIDNDCNIILSSGSISGIGGDADSSFGVCLNGGSIMMEGGSITGTGGKALNISRGVIAKDITISGGNLTGTGGTSEYFSGGITVNQNTTVNGGSLTGIGGKAEYNSIGVYCNFQNIIVNGGSLTGIADSTANGTTFSNGSYGVYAAEGQVNFSKGIFKAQGNDYATASNDSSPDAGENQRDLVFNLIPSASKYRSNQLPVDPQGAFTKLDYVWSNTHKYLLLVDNSYPDPGVTGGGSSGGSGNGPAAAPTQKIVNAPTATKTSAANNAQTFRNYDVLTPDGAKTIAGKSTEVNFDKTVGNKVLSRITMNPADLAKAVTKNVKLGVHFDAKDKAVSSVASKLGNYFSNKMVLVTYDQKNVLPVNAKFAARLDLSRLNTKTLYLYSYDSTTNKCARISAPNYFVDTKGYVHFTAPFGGTVIITDAPLAK